MQLHFPSQGHVILACDQMETANRSPSTSCSTIGMAPEFSKGQTSQNRRTGRPVPEHIMLDGRYSPQIVDWVNWSASPRACHARWSVQSPDCRLGELVGQSPSISCSVVGTVPGLSIGRTGWPVPEHIFLKNRIAVLMCDVTEHPAILSVCCIKRSAC